MNNAALAKSHGRTRRTAVLLVAFLGASIPARAGYVLGGFWYGERYELTGHFVQWLIDQRADGTFALEFHAHLHCEFKFLSWEAGIWHVSGDRYVTVTQFLDGRATESRKDYRIEHPTQTQMHFRHIESGRLHIGHRVESEFVIPHPDCSLGLIRRPALPRRLSAW